jgi:hypothetical protein
MDQEDTDTNASEPDQDATPESNGLTVEAAEPRDHGRELLSLEKFLGLAFEGGALLIIALAAVYQRLNILTIALVVLAVLLGLILLTPVGQAVWFQRAQSSVLVVALLVGGVFITTHKIPHKARHHPEAHTVSRVVGPKIEVSIPRTAGPGEVSKVGCPQTVSGTVLRKRANRRYCGSRLQAI